MANDNFNSNDQGGTADNDIVSPPQTEAAQEALEMPMRSQGETCLDSLSVTRCALVTMLDLRGHVCTAACIMRLDWDQKLCIGAFLEPRADYNEFSEKVVRPLIAHEVGVRLPRTLNTYENRKDVTQDAVSDFAFQSLPWKSFVKEVQVAPGECVADDSFRGQLLERCNDKALACALKGVEQFKRKELKHVGFIDAFAALDAVESVPAPSSNNPANLLEEGATYACYREVFEKFMKKAPEGQIEAMLRYLEFPNKEQLAELPVDVRFYLRDLRAGDGQEIKEARKFIEKELRLREALNDYDLGLNSRSGQTKKKKPKSKPKRKWKRNATTKPNLSGGHDEL